MTGAGAPPATIREAARPTVLRLSTAPTTHALAGVLAVLHSRGASVRQLSWTAGPGPDVATATMLVDIEPRRHQHLREALRRLVLVTSVVVAPWVEVSASERAQRVSAGAPRPGS